MAKYNKNTRSSEKPDPEMIFCKCQKCGATWRQYKNRPVVCKVCESTDIYTKKYTGR